MRSDIHNPPVDCIKEMIRLAKEGKIVTIEFWAHESHVQAYTFDWLLERQDNQPVFGESPDMAEFAECCKELHAVLAERTGEQPMSAQMGVGGWVLETLLQTVVAILIDKISNGELQELIQALLDQILDRLNR